MPVEMRRYCEVIAAIRQCVKRPAKLESDHFGLRVGVLTSVLEFVDEGK